MADLEELKPCPFCGGKADQRPVRDGTKTRCTRCSADVVAYNGPDDPGGARRSAEQWNRRAPDPRLEEAEKALKPFARSVELLDDGIAPDLLADDDMSIEAALFEHQQPTVGDLRRARAAHKRLKGDQS